MRISRLAACATLVAAGLFGGSGAWGAALKIATLSPEGSAWMRLLREAGEQVTEQTDGRVTFKFYPGGVMGDDTAVLRKMRLGQLHGAVVTAGALIPYYTDIQLYNVPMLFESLEEVDFARSRLDGRIQTGLEEAGYVSFGLAEVGFAYAMSQEPVTKVSEVRSQKVWVPEGDEGSARALQAFGVTPIPLSIADVLGGLQTGLINSVAVPPVGAIALQWHTQLTHVTDLPLLYVYGLLTIAERPFNRASEADQQVIRDVMAKVVSEVNDSSRKDHASAIDALRNQGLVFSPVAEADMGEWRTQADAAGKELVSGGYITEEMHAALLEAVADFRAGE